MNASRQTEAPPPTSWPESTDSPARRAPAAGEERCSQLLRLGGWHSPGGASHPKLSTCQSPVLYERACFSPCWAPHFSGISSVLSVQVFLLPGGVARVQKHREWKNLAALGLATNSSLSQQPWGFLLTGTTGSFILGLSEVWPGKAPVLLLAQARPDDVPTQGADTHEFSRDPRPGKEQMGASLFFRGSKSPCPGRRPMHPLCPA